MKDVALERSDLPCTFLANDLDGFGAFSSLRRCDVSGRKKLMKILSKTLEKPTTIGSQGVDSFMSIALIVGAKILASRLPIPQKRKSRALEWL